MVCKRRKQEDDLRQVKQTKQGFRGNKARWPQLEDKTEQWVIEERTAGRSISTVSIRLKATAVARDMNTNDLRGGFYCCICFMKRCSLSIHTRTTISQQLPKDYKEKMAISTSTGRTRSPKRRSGQNTSPTRTRSPSCLTCP